MALLPRILHHARPAQDGFLLPLSTAASLLLMLSSLSLQAAALQSRSQAHAGQRLRQAEDALMSAAQHLLADPLSVDQLATRVGETGQVGPVAYRLVRVEGPSWQDRPEAGAPQRGRAVATLELLASAEQPRPLQAAFALDLMRQVAPEGAAFPPPQLVALRELGLRGRPAAVGAP
jgi:hypothetical protein